LVAITLRSSPLPCVRRIFAISFLASLQVSLNHGAKVLPHLLGFLGMVLTMRLTTPASTAYSKRNRSTSFALSEFSMEVFSTNDLNLPKNYVFCVKSVHV
jgi:hypothetical protein